MTLAFSPDGKTLASSDGEDAILWDVVGRKKAKSLDRRGVDGFAYSPDGKILAAKENDTVNAWAVGAVGFSDHLAQARPGSCVAFSPDGKILVTGGPDLLVKLWKVDGYKYTFVKNLKDHDGQVLCVAFSPDGKTFASGAYSSYYDYSNNPPKEVKLWDVATGKNTATLKGNPWRPHTLAFSPDGSVLAFVGEKNTIKLYDIRPASQPPAPPVEPNGPDAEKNPAAARKLGGDDFETWEDPNERAFTLQIPRGWKAKGGMSRVGPARIPRGEVTVTSPDGRVVLRMGQPGPWFSELNDARRQAGLKEGDTYGDTPIRKYHPGAEAFIEFVLPSWRREGRWECFASAGTGTCLRGS
jgi:hypothetical protein